MMVIPQRLNRFLFQTVVLLELLGTAAIVHASGSWSEVTLPLGSNQIAQPTGIALDPAGNLYVVESADGSRLLERDRHGNWTVVAPDGDVSGGVGIPAIASDAAGSLYVLSWEGIGEVHLRLRKRDLRGFWTVIPLEGVVPYRAFSPQRIAVDASGNLFLAESWLIMKRDTSTTWSMIASQGVGVNQVNNVTGLAVDASGNLYVSEGEDITGGGPRRIQRRDAQGKWSVIAGISDGSQNPLPSGKVDNPQALAMDQRGDLYIADRGFGVQEWDPQGHWTVIATTDSAPFGPWGPTFDVSFFPTAIAVDRAGGIYVADAGRHQVQKYTPSGKPGPGDLDGDGRVTVADATVALQIAAGLSIPTDAQAAVGDFNGDGTVDLSDVIAVLRKAIGL